MYHERDPSPQINQSSSAPSEQNVPVPTLSVYAPSAYSSSNPSSSHPPSMYNSSHSSFIQMPPEQGLYPPTSMYAPSAYTSTTFTSSHPPSMYSSAPSSYNPMASNPLFHPQLHLQTSFSDGIPVSPLAHAKYPSPPASLIPESLEPSHLKLYNFGSRFLPHTTSPIRCLLPLSNHHLLLIGHDDGLSVLDMFPHDWIAEENGEDEKGPADAEARLIWEGEG